MPPISFKMCVSWSHRLTKAVILAKTLNMVRLIAGGREFKFLLLHSANHPGSVCRSIFHSSALMSASSAADYNKSCPFGLLI